jgi:predicted nuclease of predicted toxin-antitoxin system
MNFLIDAQLSPALIRLFREKGHTCIHTRDLINKNQTSDRDINDVSIKENLIVVTKDTDFYYSFILFKRPYKVVFVTLGNMRLRATISHFEKIIDTLLEEIAQHDMIEVTPDGINILA